MRTDVLGPAAQLIDFGYAVKRPLCEQVDQAFGVGESEMYSLTRFLDHCYVMRRPGFVTLDFMTVAWVRFWS